MASFFIAGRAAEMALKFKLDSLSDLPEAQQSLYTELDGVFVLDVDGAADAAELERFKQKAVQAEDDAIKFRLKLKEYKELGTPEEIQGKIKGAGDNEDHDKIVAQLKSDFQAKEEEYRSQIATMRKNNDKSAIMSELIKAGFAVPDGNDVAVQMVADFALSRVSYDNEGNQRIMTADGAAPMIGNAQNGGATFTDLAKDLAKSMPHLVKDEGKGGGGKLPANGGTPAKSFNEMTSLELKQLRETNPQEYDRLKAERK